MFPQDILEFPRGIRSLPLKDNTLCRRVSRTDVTPEGSVAIQLLTLKKDKMTKRPEMWRLEIIRATNLISVTKKLSNPYCEITWRGPAEKNGRTLVFTTWQEVGVTKVKERTVHPEYKRDNDDNVFDLPPVWTEAELERRGPSHAGPLTGGGWVSRNNIPSPPKQNPSWGASLGKLIGSSVSSSVDDDNAELVEEEEEEDEDPTKAAEEKRQKDAERLQFDISVAITKETANRVEMTKLLWAAEEKERVCMGNEERSMRAHIVEMELERCEPYVIKQNQYSKQFGKLTANIQSPPSLLTRARFMMGEEVDAGGLRVICQDPSTNKLFTVTTLSILYPEDEVELTTQLNRLVGNQHQNIVKVLDYSVHQIRAYNARGFASVNERMAIIILEKLDGMLATDYINSLSDADFNDETFQHLLKQIASGLVCLHEEGIVHRNMCPEAVMVQTNMGLANKRLRGGPVTSPKPRCRLGEYWVLYNPRKVGCEYSNGRADWGAQSTMPPDAVRGRVTEKSDVYAFGLCVYFWATGGLSLKDRLPMTAQALEKIKAQIPLKWGIWVHSLLRMCLQVNPDVRASAKEVLEFLSTRIGR